MRTIVISAVSKVLLDARATHGLCGGRQLSDTSWEIEVDDEVAFRLDQISGDPDEAIRMLCATGVGHA
jgi:hypothetical protein